MEVCLAPVHEVQQDLQVVRAGAVQDDEELQGCGKVINNQTTDDVIIIAVFQKVKLISYLVVERCRPDGRVVEYGCEMGAACCQHETVRFEGLTCGQERRKIRSQLPQ